MIWNSTLKRKAPLRSKREMSSKKFVLEQARKPLKKVAKSRRSQMQKYYRVRNEFLARPENQVCAICELRQLSGEMITVRLATEVHHARGRIGRLLCDERFFVASCRGCREFPHTNTLKARAWGILASPSEWNVFPENS